jgi:archaellum component FlaC
MTIDERLEKLAERHEALTQTVELLAVEIRELKDTVGRHDGQLETLVRVTQQDAENIRALARIAEIHHQRLERLEGGPQ